MKKQGCKVYVTNNKKTYVLNNKKHMDNTIQWWGYVHQNETLHVKRYFDIRDLEEAYESPFVQSIHGPWMVNSREEAMARLVAAIDCRIKNKEKV